MLTDVGRWYDQLRLTDIVVFNENDLQQIANLWVIVNNISHSSDQTNDCLGLYLLSVRH